MHYKNQSLFSHPTRYATKGHSMSLQITASVSSGLSTKTKSYNVESAGQIWRTGSTGYQEPYKLCYLSPYKPSVSSSLSVGKSRSIRPVNQNHITVFSVEQGVFKLRGIVIFASWMKKAERCLCRYIVRSGIHDLCVGFH